MSEYYHVVPWFNSNEWQIVYDKLFSNSSTLPDKQEALNLLLMWKARCPSLPSGVESTVCLLEVHIEDMKNSETTVNNQLFRLAYSSAIMRFVNHMLDSEIAKGISLYQAAKTLGVPDWIIDLRHDTAHNNKLPSIELLREASLIGLEWLHKNYWDKYKECIQDYVSGQKHTTHGDDNDCIAALMSFCISLSIVHTKCKIKNLAEINDYDIQESIVKDTRELFGDHVDMSNLKKVSLTSLINIFNVHSKKFLKGRDITSLIQVLLGEDSLFLSFELLHFMGSREFYNKNTLSRQYVQCFEVLLSFLHTNDLLQDFILELIKITQTNDCESKCRLAALWVSNILKALKKSKQFMLKMNKQSSEAMKLKKQKELKALYHHWFPNEKVDGLVLDLQKSVPKIFRDINSIQTIISTYNPYLTFFVKDLLNLVEPHLPKQTSEKVCKLAKLISSPKNLASQTSKIYTIEDLEMFEDEIDASETDSDCCEVTLEMETDCVNNECINTKWKLAPTEHSWSTCPIGLLPWQQN